MNFNCYFHAKMFQCDFYKKAFVGNSIQHTKDLDLNSLSQDSHLKDLTYIIFDMLVFQFLHVTKHFASKPLSQGSHLKCFALSWTVFTCSLKIILLCKSFFTRLTFQIRLISMEKSAIRILSNILIKSIYFQFQFVSIVMILQAGSILLPYKLWQKLENGLMQEFHHKSRIFSKEEVEKNVLNFVSILHQNSSYFTQFLMCEFLNFLVLIFNYCLTNWFLNGQFYHYGWEVLSFYRYLNVINV